jgi:RNA polymerase sigma factor (TIGR02999 family)
MSHVTRLLDAAAAGDRTAAADLLPLVYDELRALAAARMSAEAPGHTLDATALVHEAYLRLVGDQQFEGRGHFFAAAAEAMRRILVDAARRKRRAKHGGNYQRVELDAAAVAAPSPHEDLVALDEALTQLSVEDPQAARLVELRHFAGLTIPESAQVLGISSRTADRLWAFARAWLHREITQHPGKSESGRFSGVIPAPRRIESETRQSSEEG